MTPNLSIARTSQGYALAPPLCHSLGNTLEAFMNDDDKLKQLHDEASKYLDGQGDMGLA